MTMIQPARPKPIRKSKTKTGLTETDLHYRQSIIALIALALLCMVSIASFHILDAETAVTALAAASPAVLAFFRTITRIGGKRK